MLNVLFTTINLPVNDIQDLGSKTEVWYKGRVLIEGEWKWGLWNSKGQAIFNNTGNLK